MVIYNAKEMALIKSKYVSAYYSHNLPVILLGMILFFGLAFWRFMHVEHFYVSSMSCQISKVIVVPECCVL